MLDDDVDIDHSWLHQLVHVFAVQNPDLSGSSKNDVNNNNNNSGALYGDTIVSTGYRWAISTTSSLIANVEAAITNLLSVRILLYFCTVLNCVFFIFHKIYFFMLCLFFCLSGWIFHRVLILFFKTGRSSNPWFSVGWFICFTSKSMGKARI